MFPQRNSPITISEPRPYELKNKNKKNIHDTGSAVQSGGWASAWQPHAYRRAVPSCCLARASYQWLFVVVLFRQSIRGIINKTTGGAPPARFCAWRRRRQKTRMMSHAGGTSQCECCVGSTKREGEQRKLNGVGGPVVERKMVWSGVVWVCESHKL